MGAQQKSSTSAKVPPKGALFPPLGTCLQIDRFLDTPGPQERSSRSHKTSISTFSPYPQNDSKMTSPNLPFGHLWPQKSQKVLKRSVSENPPKTRLQKIRKKLKHYPQMRVSQFTLFTVLAPMVPDQAPKGAQTPKIPHFSSKPTLF